MDCSKCVWPNPETCRRCRQDQAEKLAVSLHRPSAEPNKGRGQGDRRNPSAQEGEKLINQLYNSAREQVK